ncbi:MAG: HEAT repeat domain-containing protein [Pirellulaceae bacterium]
MREIGRSGEPAAIPYIIEYLFSPSDAERLSAAQAVHSLVEATSPEDLPWLDEEIRSWSWSYGRRESWSQLNPSEVRKTSFPPEFETSVFGLMSCHPNGRVREAAVKRLGTSAHPEALRFLLVRLNDWVPNIRQTALQIVHNRLEGPIDPFVPNLYLVSRLAECQRADFSEFIRAVAQKLVLPEHVDVLFRLIEQGSWSAARQWFAVVLSLPGDHHSRFIRAGLKSSDIVVRLRSVQSAPNMLREDELASLLTEVRQNKLAAVRLQALSAYVDHFPNAAPGALRESLLDRSASVREFARFYLRKAGENGFADYYRKALQDDKTVRVALLGLGETGNETDLPLVLPYLDSSVTSRRTAAIQSLSRLADDRFVNVFLDHLQDESPRVVRTAGQWVSGRPHLIDLDRINHLLSTDSRAHVRQTALIIFGSADFWKALPHLIRAAQDDDDDIRTRARGLVEKRYNRIYTKPSSQQASRIRQALDEGAGRLDEQFVQGLTQWLSGLAIPPWGETAK